MTWDDAPWTAGGLRITRAALAQVESDAAAGYLAEQEACGYLVGPSSDPLLCDRAVTLENIAKQLHEADPRTYNLAPRSFFAFRERSLDVAVEDGLERGVPVKVLYHSHLDVGAYLSETDEAVLSRGAPPRLDVSMGQLGPGPQWPLAFLVSSVRGGESAPYVDDHKLFVWRAGRFEPSTFELV